MCQGLPLTQMAVAWQAHPFVVMGTLWFYVHCSICSDRAAEFLALKHESRILGHSSNIPTLYVEHPADDQNWDIRIYLIRPHLIRPPPHSNVDYIRPRICPRQPQSTSYRMSHIEAKSINIWLRYDPKM